MIAPPNEHAVVVARWWRERRTVYQVHASWHEASRLDARGFDSMVKLFAALRRGECVDCHRQAA